MLKTLSPVGKSSFTDYCKDHPYIATGSAIAITGIVAYTAYSAYNNNIYRNIIDSDLREVEKLLEIPAMIDIPERIDIKELDVLDYPLFDESILRWVTVKLKEVQPIMSSLKETLITLDEITITGSEGVLQMVLDTSMQSINESINIFIHMAEVVPSSALALASIGLSQMLHAFGIKLYVFAMNKEWFTTIYTDSNKGKNFVEYVFDADNLQDMQQRINQYSVRVPDGSANIFDYKKLPPTVINSTGQILSFKEPNAWLKFFG